MTTRLNSASFRSQIDELDAWLISRGFTQRDRFRRYKSNLDEMEHRGRKVGNRAQLFSDVEDEGRLSEILSSYVDVIEFVTTFTILRKKNVDIPQHLLKKALDGPADATKERPTSNAGRNAMFELVMAAVIANQDLAPILGQENPDIEFKFKDRRVLLECKRVFSANSLKDNISTAIDQLDKCVNVSAKDIGIVSVSVSRLAYQGNRYLVTSSSSEGNAYLANELHHLITDFDSRLKSLSTPSVAGIIFNVSCPLYVQNRGFTVSTAGMLYPMDLQEREILLQLAKTLHV